MSDAAQAMLLIKSLDPEAHVAFSEFTGQWYVAARIDLSDGYILASVCEHRDSPEWAVNDFLDRLTHVDRDHVIAAKPAGERRNFQWNGGAFVEVRDSCLPWKLGKATA